MSDEILVVNEVTVIETTEPPVEEIITEGIQGPEGPPGGVASAGNGILIDSDTKAISIDPSIVATQEQLTDAIISANTYTDTVVNPVKTLAEVNQLNIANKADQTDLDATNTAVTNLTVALALTANQTDLDALATELATKATPADVSAAIAALVDGAPTALDTLNEIAQALAGEQATINDILTALGNRVRVDAAQSLTSGQQAQARSNINAEAVGVAAALVAAITPASIGAATATQGGKADTALQSGDVTPVALSGSFSDLINKSSMFNLVYSAYVIGSNVAIAATDSLGQMLGKLQSQISSLATVAKTGSYTDLINKPTIPTPSMTIVTKTANYTITAADNGKTILFTGGNPTFSSVASLGSGFNCTIINLVGVTAFTITANTGDKFDGGLSSFQIKNLQGVQIFCDGTYLRLGLGKAPILYSEYATAGTTRPSASGSQSVAIGSGAASNGSDSFAEGTGAQALGTKSIAIGSSATATNANDQAFGYGASTAGTNSNANSAIAMGVNAKTTQAGEFGWCIGDQNFLSNRMQLSAVATAASTNYPLVAKPSGGGTSQQTYNQIPVLANGTTTFSGIVTVKQKNANGQTMMAWRIEGVAWGDSFGANVTLVSSTITAMAGMTAPTGWGLTIAADLSRMCVAVTFNMGSTAMNLTAFADITIEKMTYA